MAEIYANKLVSGGSSEVVQWTKFSNIQGSNLAAAWH